MRVGLSTTTIFGDSSGYFFGNVRYKASNIIWRYATHCRPVIDCKMSDSEMTLNGYFTPNSVFVPEILDLEGSAFKNNCVKTDKVRPILSAARMQADNSSMRQYKSFVHGVS